MLRQRRIEEYDPERLGLPKPPGFIRTFFRRNPWIVDTALMAMFYYATLASVIAVAVTDVSLPLTLLVALFAIVTTAGILFRRFVPRILAGVTCASLLIVVPGSSPGSTASFAFVIALYALAVYRSARSAWIFTLIGTGAAVAGTAMSGQLDPITLFVAFIGYSMSFVMATLIGITVGNRARYLDALLGRAAQLARERDQQAQLATASERARIAREMHDIVAHSLTVMIALADGATSTATSDPERAKDAMGHVAEIGRTSLTDMRRVLGVLTQASGDGADGETAADSGLALAPLAPQPTFDELRPLVDSYRAAGLPIMLTVSGAVPQEPAVQLTVFRVVQESLTNALRYARTPSRVDVVVDFSAANEASASITDDGLALAGDAPAAASLGSGRGLIGMRERVALYGGTVEAGPLHPHGWQVRAVIPTTPVETTSRSITS
ncbi:Signal transduction histidine kinase [Agreia sp. COWG]|nr:Signal transduction histidine kinase [Agreia sp. COWG]